MGAGEAKKLKLPASHYKITSPHNCDCFLCRRWQEAQKELEGVKDDNTIPPSKKRLLIERRNLVAELRLDFWSEICWYAKEGGWRPGWGKRAWEIIKRDEKSWVMQLQYVSMEEWLLMFEEYMG